MKEYTVTSIKLGVAIGAIIGLKAEQAAPRMHCLKKTKEAGVYEVILPIEFKRGETILMKAESKAELADITESKKSAEKKPAEEKSQGKE